MGKKKDLLHTEVLFPPGRTCSPRQSRPVSARPLADPTLVALSPPLPAPLRRRRRRRKKRKQTTIPTPISIPTTTTATALRTLGKLPGCAALSPTLCTGPSQRPTLGRWYLEIRSRAFSRLIRYIHTTVGARRYNTLRVKPTEVLRTMRKSGLADTTLYSTGSNQCESYTMVRSNSGKTKRKIES